MTEKTDHYLSLAKTINDYESAVDLIQKVIESPFVHSFSEFLDLPFFQSLKNHENYGKFYKLLELFSYGTFSDYIANKVLYPELNESSKTKLKHLTIITIASKNRAIPYKHLCEQLNLNNIRQLEDLIIEAFYSNIIKGKLDQLNNQLEIEFAIGRDVTNQQIDDILNVLDSWCKNCDIALKTIEVQISQANLYKQKQIEKQANIDLEVLNLKKSIKIQSQEVESMSKDSKKSIKMKGTKGSSGKSSNSVQK